MPDRPHGGTADWAGNNCWGYVPGGAVVTHDLTFSVPGVPSGKGRHRMTRTGLAYTPAATVAAERAIRAAFRESYPRAKPHDGPVEIAVLALFEPPSSWPKWKRSLALAGLWTHQVAPDCDNIAKAILALNGIAYADDAQVYDCHTRREYSDVARTVVRLRMFDAQVKP